MAYGSSDSSISVVEPAGFSLPTCTCSLELFSTITALQTTAPSPSLNHCIFASRRAIATAKASLEFTSCLSSLMSAYSSFILLSILLSLLVQFYRQSLEVAQMVAPDEMGREAALAMVRGELGLLYEVATEMERLSRTSLPEMNVGEFWGTDEKGAPVCQDFEGCQGGHIVAAVGLTLCFGGLFGCWGSEG